MIVHCGKTIFILLLSFLLIAGCAREGVDTPGKQRGEGRPSGSSGFEMSNASRVPRIMDKKLNDFPSVTIGEAFDRYRFFVKKEWDAQQSTQSKNIYVDFTGWLDAKSLSDAARKEGVSVQGVGIKFVVYPDGSFKAAMASKLEMKADGTLQAYPSDDLTGILAKIYENKEITF